MNRIAISSPHFTVSGASWSKVSSPLRFCRWCTGHSVFLSKIVRFSQYQKSSVFIYPSRYNSRLAWVSGFSNIFQADKQCTSPTATWQCVSVSVVWRVWGWVWGWISDFHEVSCAFRVEPNLNEKAFLPEDAAKFTTTLLRCDRARVLSLIVLIFGSVHRCWSKPLGN